ncbi:MAG: MFS transporter, partial [Micropruina sp.]
SVLLAARFVQGLGAGVMNVAIMVLVGRVYDERERARIMTWFSGCWMLPAFAGPAVAAWVAQTFSWHWVFWGLLPLVFVAGVLVFVPLRAVRMEGQPSEAGGKRHLGLAAGVAVGVALIQLAGQNLQLLSLAQAGVGLVALWLCLPPLMPRGFSWIGSGVSATVSTRTLTAGAFFGAEAFIPLMLVETRQLGLFEAGTTLTIGSLGWMLGAWLQSRPWLRLRRDTLITLGAGCIAVGLASVALGAWFAGVWLVVLALGWTLAGLGMGLSVASGSLVVMQVSAGDELGRNTSALQVGEALGTSLFAGLAGTWFAYTHQDFPAPVSFGGLLTVMVLAGLAGTIMARRIGPVRNHSLSQ